jgi:hypothetical protein
MSLTKRYRLTYNNVLNTNLQKSMIDLGMCSVRDTDTYPDKADTAFDIQTINFILTFAASTKQERDSWIEVKQQNN